MLMIVGNMNNFFIGIPERFKTLYFGAYDKLRLIPQIA